VKEITRGEMRHNVFEKFQREVKERGRLEVEVRLVCGKMKYLGNGDAVD